MGDRSETLNELFFGHSNSEILDRDGVGCVVRADFDLEIQIFVEDVLLGQFDVPDFLQGIGTIGYQFADEDLFLRVKRMDNYIQELLNFRLELMFFYIGCAHESRCLFVLKRLFGYAPRRGLQVQFSDAPRKKDLGRDSAGQADYPKSAELVEFESCGSLGNSQPWQFRVLLGIRF